MITRTIYQAGNSAVITVPAHILTKLSLHIGSKVDIDWLTKTAWATWPSATTPPPGLLFDTPAAPHQTRCPHCGQLCG